ncbi:twin-arginine translocation signal domain-containing protein [Haliscomenobacter hydrossis]
MLTRRSFLQQSMLGSGAVLLGASGCQPSTPTRSGGDSQDEGLD